MVRLTKSVKERKRSLINPAISKTAPGIKCLTRRRGDELLAAIFSATIGQLAEVGYSALSFEAGGAASPVSAGFADAVSLDVTGEVP